MSIVLKFLDITHQSRLHQVVPRTTLNIDQPVLKELQRLQKQSGKSLGALVSELLVEALEVRSRGGVRLLRVYSGQVLRWELPLLIFWIKKLFSESLTKHELLH